MSVIRRPLVITVFSALIAIGSASTQLALAQTGGLPSDIPLDILSPEQLEELRRQIGGVMTGSGTSADREDTTARRRDRLEELEGQIRKPDEEEEAEPLIPILKGEDSVIIEIDFVLAEREAPTVTTRQADVQAIITAPQWPPVSQQPVPQQPQQRDQEMRREKAREALPANEQERLEKLIALIRSRNPYQLSKDGVLFLPGFAGIPLGGLTERQATLRLDVDPAFKDLDIRLTRLPLKKWGVAALKPFGYDLFSRAPSTFAPTANVPVPADYVVGPGDQLTVQLYGTQNRNLTLTVARDGSIRFPELGPINVSGQRFSAVKANIEARVARQMIGVRASVSMGDTRSIRVFVLGAAKRQGVYTISGLGTMTSALYAAGGVAQIGSLRSIQLKRQGDVVRELDLYDMLIHGDTSDDAKLLPSDTIFIPPIGQTISVEGEVRRPAIYELKAETTIANVIELAGGLTPESDASKATVTRILDGQRRVVVPVDMSSEVGLSQTVRNGDLFRIARLRPTLDSGVVVQGHVHAPGAVAFREGLRLSDVIRSVDDLMPNGDLHYVLIRRELAPDRTITSLSADLGAALEAPGSAADVQLMPRDRVIVFDLESGRERIIRPLLEELRLQSSRDRPATVVRVSGQVKVSGEYPLEPGMTVKDLIRAGGGLAEGAYGGRAELTRYKVVNGESRRTELIEINLAAVLRGEASANIALEAFDSLSIKEVPEWGEQEVVMLRGEVRFPGQYSIKRGETLKSVIVRAGGLNEYAFPDGSVFSREELKKREQEQLDVLANRLQNDLITLSLQGAAANQTNAAAALSVGQALLAQIRTAEAVGRLVIDLPRALRAEVGSINDIVLRGGDQLTVPRYQQEVTVIGEVQNATSHLYRPELSRDDYISLSGGNTKKADRGKIYVVRANGSVVSAEGNRWFRNGSRVAIKPGDTIVVPLDTERLPVLPFWQTVAQIIANLTVSAAAINSFD